MIHGIGTDIVSIKRISELYKKSGDRFAQKILSKKEFEKFTELKEKNLINPGKTIISKNTKNKTAKTKTPISNTHVSYLAKRFAGKEAVTKAFGTGIGAEIAFKDISILNDKKGKPYVEVSHQRSVAALQSSDEDKVKKDSKTKNRNPKYKIEISLSDEKDYAIAFVVISA